MTVKHWRVFGHVDALIDGCARDHQAERKVLSKAAFEFSVPCLGERELFDDTTGLHHRLFDTCDQVRGAWEREAVSDVLCQKCSDVGGMLDCRLVIAPLYHRGELSLALVLGKCRLKLISHPIAYC